MIDPAYRAQVELLLRLLPHIGQESCFGLKGGTAINLFHRDMPRLSVDIDLTYLPFDDRTAALTAIADALARIKQRLESSIPAIQIRAVPLVEGQDAKLICQLGRAIVKIEANTVMRGHLWPVRHLELVPSAQDEFRMFAAATVVSDGELFGGKICAALNRQHPRDLFDVHVLLQQGPITDELRLGFIASLISHPSPMHEVLRPIFKDQRLTFDSQFAGMALVPFTYDDFEAARESLVTQIHTTLNDDDRAFLLGLKKGAPDWTLFPIEAIKRLPAVQWKLANIQSLKKNVRKHSDQIKALEAALAAR